MAAAAEVVVAAAAAAEAARNAGARGGAGRGGGGAEVVRRGGPCRPCLGCGPGRAIGGRPGAAARLSSSLAVAAAAKGPRLRTRGTRHRSESASTPSLPPARLPLPRPQGEPVAGRRAAGDGRRAMGDRRPAAARASAPAPKRAASSHGNVRVTAARHAPRPALARPKPGGPTRSARAGWFRAVRPLVPSASVAHGARGPATGRK